LAIDHINEQSDGLLALTLVGALALPVQSIAAGTVVDIGFEIDAALPVLYTDLSLGYSDLNESVPFQLPGGEPLGINENDFTYPAARIGKFLLDAAAVGTLFSPNDQVATSISLKMSITDLDTNPNDDDPVVEPDDDFEDIIFALSLSDADDGTTLLRVLSDTDGTNTITPQFITGFGNQALDADPDTAINDYDLSGAPVLGSELADLFSNSIDTDTGTAEVWLYIIDADDAGNKISLANSLETNFALSVDFADVAPIPLPPAALLFGGALVSLLCLRRGRI